MNNSLQDLDGLFFQPVWNPFRPVVSDVHIFLVDMTISIPMVSRRQPIAKVIELGVKRRLDAIEDDPIAAILPQHKRHQQ